VYSRLLYKDYFLHSGTGWMTRHVISENGTE